MENKQPIKEVIIVIVLSILFCLGGIAQTNIKIDTKGNYIAVATKDTTAINTGKTYTDLKGIVSPVFANKKGKLFVVKTSKKTGKIYKQYLKL